MLVRAEKAQMSKIQFCPNGFSIVTCSDSLECGSRQRYFQIWPVATGNSCYNNLYYIYQEYEYLNERVREQESVCVCVRVCKESESKERDITAYRI